MANSSKTAVNVICSVLVLATSVGISFFLSPYIVQNIGVEANGFVNLANNMLAYAQLIVSALNSMASRFITLEYVKKNYAKANLYYNSVFWGNILIVGVLFLPAVLCIANLELLFDVPSLIRGDVKVLFTVIFSSFFITTALPNYDCGTFVTNRLDRSYIPQMLASILKCSILIYLFSTFSPHVYYVGIAAFVSTVFTLISNAYNTHRLTPELAIRFIDSKPIISISAMKELVLSGVWNSIHNVGQLFLSGLDLLLCNLTFSSTAMGIISLSKMLPDLFQQLGSTVCAAFLPDLTIIYAREDWKGLFNSIRRSMNITAFLLTIPLACLIAFGDTFYSLWVPSQNPHLLQILSFLSIFGLIVTSGIQVLYSVFTITNHVRENALAVLLSGAISLVFTIILIRNTDLGIFAVAGTSSFVSLLRNLLFTVPMGARYLGLKWTTFYPQIGKTIFTTTVVSIFGLLIRLIIPQSSWLYFVLSVVALVACGFGVNYYVILSKEDRRSIRLAIRKLRLN